MDLVKPKFEKNNIPIVLASDENFVPYLGVTIKSIIENSSVDNNYDIVILNTNIDQYSQKRMKLMENANISIRFYDMNTLMANYAEIWRFSDSYPTSIYYRFFIPQMYREYNKVIYLDSDIILNCDISELYSINMEDKPISACADIPRQLENDFYNDFIINDLKITPKQYFNSGVIIFNVPKINIDVFVQQCVQSLGILKKSIFFDQDVLNYIFKGNVKYLDNSYNLSWNCLHFWKGIKNKLPKDTYEAYKKAVETPKIIHYAGAYKPWKQPELYYSEYFWKYARKTPFYEEILYKNMEQFMDRKLNKPPFFKTLLQNIFSIKNTTDGNHKVITILWIRLKIKRGRKEC